MFGSAAKGKLIRHLLEHSVERDVSMAVLAESVYESQRRPSCHTLEGHEHTLSFIHTYIHIFTTFIHTYIHHM